MLDVVFGALVKIVSFAFCFRFGVGLGFGRIHFRHSADLVKVFSKLFVFVLVFVVQNSRAHFFARFVRISFVKTIEILARRFDQLFAVTIAFPFEIEVATFAEKFDSA